MKKRITSIVGLGTCALMVLSFAAALPANAQLFPYTGSSSAFATPTIATTSSSTFTTSTGTASTGTTSTNNASNSTITTGTTTTGTTNSTAMNTTTTVPVTVPNTTTSPLVPSIATVTTPGSGYIQFNNLVVLSLSSVVPAEIIAGNSTNGTTMVGLGTCMQFATPSSVNGTPVPCPVPSSQPVPQPQSTISTTTTIANGQNSYAPYHVEIDSTTKILLSNRKPGVLANITAGDQINVFGLYNANGNGTIAALIVRDLSKPATSSGLLPVTTPLPAGTNALTNGAMGGISSTGTTSGIGMNNTNNAATTGNTSTVHGSVLGTTMSNPSLGTITQVNADGSFVLLLNNGQSVTIPSPQSKIQVGATVTLQQVLAAIQQVLTEINILSDMTGTTSTSMPNSATNGASNTMPNTSMPINNTTTAPSTMQPPVTPSTGATSPNIY